MGRPKRLRATSADQLGPRWSISVLPAGLLVPCYGSTVFTLAELAPSFSERPREATPNIPDSKVRSAALQARLSQLGFVATPIFRHTMAGIEAWTVSVDDPPEVFLDVSEFAALGVAPDALRRAFDEGVLDEALLFADGEASLSPLSSEWRPLFFPSVPAAMDVLTQPGFVEWDRPITQADRPEIERRIEAGATGVIISGFRPGELAAVRAINRFARKHGCSFVVDESLTGFGRTGTFAAWQQWNLPYAPDAFVVGHGGGAMAFSQHPVWNELGEMPITCAALTEARMTLSPWSSLSLSVLGSSVHEHFATLASTHEFCCRPSGRGGAWSFELPSADAAQALDVGCRKHGLRLSVRKNIASVFFARGIRPRDLKFVFRVIDNVLTHLESGVESAPPPTTRKTSAASDSRVRVVASSEVGSMLARIVALEALIYEPARRDPPEKLRKAFDDPDGVVVAAEVREEDRWVLAGFSLAVPLEAVNVDGANEDHFYGAANTLYALSTTLDPNQRGFGFGLRMKQRLVAQAQEMRTADETPRYRFVSGRNRVGATGAMQRVNARLGAYNVDHLSGQYGGQGEAYYYRLPVGPIARPLTCTTKAAPNLAAPNNAARDERAERAFGGLRRPLREAPRSWREALADGSVSGAALVRHALSDALYPATVEALEAFAGLLPDLPRVGVFSTETQALASLAALKIGGPHYVLGAGLPLGARARRVDYAHDVPPDGLLIVEVIDRLSGEVRDIPAMIAEGRRVVVVESTSAYGRGGHWPLVSASWQAAPLAVVWDTGGDAALVHSKEYARLGDADEVSILRTHHQLRATQFNAFDAAAFEDALSPIGSAGQHAYRVVELAAEERLKHAGWVTGSEHGSLVIAPPLDVTKDDFLRLRHALERPHP